MTEGAADADQTDVGVAGTSEAGAAVLSTSESDASDAAPLKVQRGFFMATANLAGQKIRAENTRVRMGQNKNWPGHGSEWVHPIERITYG